MRLLAVAVLGALLLLAPRVESWSIYARPVDDVAWAIGRSQPRMSLGLRRSYARVILAEGGKRKFDSLSVVSMCHYESRWNARLVGGLGGRCVGLCQHCLFKYRKCRRDGDDSPWCQQKKTWLLNGHNNLVETARDISGWRSYCRRRTGKPALFAYWLHGFQGHGKPSRGIICGQQKTRRGWRTLPRPRLVQRVMRYRRRLIRDLGRR